MTTKPMSNTLTAVAVGAGMAFAAVAPAQAGLIRTIVDSTNPDATEAAFRNSLRTSTTETFEEPDYVEGRDGPFSTEVGDFAGTGADGDAECVGPCDDVRILDQSLSDVSGDPFADGREDPDPGNQWLDSNDMTEVTWDIGGNLTGTTNAFGLFVSDPADVNATFEVTFADGSSETIASMEDEPNSEVFYIGGVSDQSIASASVIFENVDGSQRDGFGLDDPTIGTVPAPAPIAMLGVGLLGLGAAGLRQRNRR